MLLSLLLQIVLPLGLIAWLAFAPAKSLVGYVVQAFATGLVLLALALVALWMLLPWWLPFAYALLCVLAIALQMLRHGIRFVSPWPATVSGWAALGVMCSLWALGAFLSWQGLLSRQLPEIRIVDIPLPMGPGTYLVASGGSREIVNGHMMTLDPTVERFRAYRGQSYGIDLIKINSLGFRTRGLQPKDPAAYTIYGEPIFAPCDGVVVTSRNDRPDMPVPEMDLEVIEGNHVLLDCGDFEVLLAHFQPGSVRVKAGDRVNLGEQLGVVGNSGKTGEPHLHISAQLKSLSAQPFSGEPLAITVDGRFVVRNDRIDVRR